MRGYKKIENTLVVIVGSPSGDDVSEEPVELDGGAVSVDAYLDTDDEELARRAINALDSFARVLGLESPTSESIERGSFWRRAKAFFSKGVSTHEFQELQANVERAIALRAVDAPQSEVDLKTSEAVAQLVASVNEIPQACMRVGSILLVKYQDNIGPVLLIRTMSPLEVRALERFPEIQKDPRRAIDALVTAALTLEPVADDNRAG